MVGGITGLPHSSVLDLQTLGTATSIGVSGLHAPLEIVTNPQVYQFLRQLFLVFFVNRQQQPYGYLVLVDLLDQLGFSR